MLNERIHNALGDISDDLLQSAMQSREKKKRRRSIDLAAVVAAAALVLVLLGLALLQPKEKNLITAPGVIQVLAHGVDESGNLTDETDELEEGEIFQAEKRGGSQVFPLSFLVDESQYPGMDLSLEVYASDGIFRNREADSLQYPDLPEAERLLRCYYGQTYQIDVGENIYWQTDGFDYLYMQEQVEKGNYDCSTAYRRRDFEKGPAYIHVLLLADGNIVGYCRIKITLADDSAHKSQQQFCFQVVTCISYPQVDGRWQDVSQEDIRDHLLRDLEHLLQEQEERQHDGGKD